MKKNHTYEDILGAKTVGRIVMYAEELAGAAVRRDTRRCVTLLMRARRNFGTYGIDCLVDTLAGFKWFEDERACFTGQYSDTVWTMCNREVHRRHKVKVYVMPKEPVFGWYDPIDALLAKEVKEIYNLTSRTKYLTF